MGKKNKNKQKITGCMKTVLKTEKKLNNKQKKELAAIGEDNIEEIIAQIEHEEAERQKVVEIVVDQPSRRVNFTLTPHPFKNELIMFGGEFHDGKKTTVYSDLFFYNLEKNTWTLIKSPGAPPPRCSHQTLAIPNNKGELWVFGGEYISPSESQFYHYKDLWVYRIFEKKWEKIIVSGGPSARSGHRMIYMKKQLIIFGGFYDNLREYKYFNDLYIFDLVDFKWNKVDLTTSIPTPRSGCIVLPTSDHKVLVYGGYSKEKVKKDVDKGMVHTDMFILYPDKHSKNELEWKSIQVKQTGIKFSPRCSMSATLDQSNIAYFYGGVHDDEEDEKIQGTFFNDLLTLNTKDYHWKMVNLKEDTEKSKKRRRNQCDKKNDDVLNEESQQDETMDLQTTVISDEIFTMTIGPAPTITSNPLESNNDIKKNLTMPSPRINPGLAIKNNVLYLYGGMFEDGEKVYTYNDFYKLDLHKLNEWQVIIEDDVSKQIWLDSDNSEDSSDGDSEDDDVDIGSENDSEQEMEDDEN